MMEEIKCQSILMEKRGSGENDDVSDNGVTREKGRSRSRNHVYNYEFNTKLSLQVQHTYLI